jgi:hypothetical protein
MRRFLSRVFGIPTSTTRRGRQQKSILQVEGLESRWCPSTVKVVGGHILQVHGDAGNNNVQIVQNDQANTLTVTADGQVSTFSSSQIDKIDVDLKDGNDYFWYGLATGKDFVYSKQAKIKLGKGNDEAWLEFRGGGIGGSAWLYGNLDITVDAGKGDDNLIAHFNGKHGGALNVHALMGDGNDKAFVNLWGDVSGGAKVLFDLQGGKGDDQMSTWDTFDNRAYQYSNIDILGDSAATIKMDGGQGNDKLGALYSGRVYGKLTLQENGGKGDDEVSAEVFLQAGSTGAFDGKLQGDKGNDKLDFQLHNLAGNTVSILSALLDGGKGTDACTATANVTKVNCEA